jgi:Zn-dependent M28 family amino/carboxypeptidase
MFVSFTGEEAGLRGSREFVRQAQRDSVKLVGALNNDMVGFANDERLDNTIRYSNSGIKDVQHAAAIRYTDLITYDAFYYKSTDAAAFYDAYGDIVGGIGSYPVLGNPHYHQSHDVLETINQQLVAEVSKTTVATLMYLASSPSRLVNLRTARSGSAVDVTWTPSPEKSVVRYVVHYGSPNTTSWREMTVTEPRVRIPNASEGTVVQVKAVNSRGLEGWDWARVVVQ